MIALDVHRLGLKLEEQSLIANLGSYMSLPRKGGKDFLLEFERKTSIDSDSSDFSSDLSCISEPEEYEPVRLLDTDIKELERMVETATEEIYTKL